MAMTEPQAMAPGGQAERVALAGPKAWPSYAERTCIVQVVLQRNPLRVRQLGRVVVDAFGWPFVVGAHHPAYRFLQRDGVRLFYAKR